MVRETVSPVHESLLISLPGKTGLPATLLESHVDTVPADEWSERAFTPKVEGDIVIGRGPATTKGRLSP